MNRRDELVGAVRGVARRLGTGTVSLSAFKRETGIGDTTVYRHFDSWVELCSAAGVAPGRAPGALTDDQMFAAMRDAFVAMGGIGSCKRFERHFRHGMAILYRRKLSWPAAQVAFRAWALTHAPEFPYLDELPRIAPPPRRAWARATKGANGSAPVSSSSAQGRALGEVINFRGALHAPVNENGVLVLFGMVAQDLGFVIETVAAGFPDCEAKRRLSGGRWQRVRIEFEFKSRNFCDHGHDADGCDLVVCWRHNWPDCPVEVVELRAAIAALAG